MNTKVVHVDKESFDVYIGRTFVRKNNQRFWGVGWGNPFRIGRDGDRVEVLRKYRRYLEKHPELIEKARRELTGKTLGCFCKPQACHGDILIEMMQKT